MVAAAPSVPSSSWSSAPVTAPGPGCDRPPRTPRRHASGLVGSLNAEWARLVAGDGREHAARIERWQDAEPAFAGLRRLADVLHAVTVECRDDVLRGLLVLAREGDDLAARTALQAMLGAAVRLARRTVGHADGDLDESLARAVAALWQVVRAYPTERRTCRAADGVSLDVLGLLTGAGRTRAVEIPGGLPGELVETALPAEGASGARDDFWSAACLPVSTGCSDEQLLLLLAWGARSAVITPGEARLLLRLHSPADPEAATSCRAVAAELGLEHAAVRQRASRATRRLTAAVRQLAGGTAPPAAPLVDEPRAA